MSESRERGRERRAFARWPVTLPARCYATWGSSQCVITDINEAGLTLSWTHPANIGEELTVAWKLDDGEPLQITCEVRWSSLTAAGLAFLDASLGDRLRIVAFLSGRSTKTNGN